MTSTFQAIFRLVILQKAARDLFGIAEVNLGARPRALLAKNLVKLLLNMCETGRRTIRRHHGQ